MSNAADNTAVGYKALQDNSTGTDNTAVGSDALRENTTGANNTAIGSEMLYIQIPQVVIMLLLD